MKGWAAALLWGLTLCGGVDADAPVSPPSAELLGQAPWPGMSALDAVWCRELVYAARFVQIRGPDGSMKTLWVHDARGWRKPNGFYGLLLNGAKVDEGTVWIVYAGRLTNLRVLFSYGSATVDPEFSKDHAYRDAANPESPK